MSIVSEKLHDMLSWVSYSASGGLIVFGMALNDIAVLSGIAFAALTYITNSWFKYQHLKLAREAQKAACPVIPNQED